MTFLCWHLIMGTGEEKKKKKVIGVGLCDKMIVHEQAKPGRVAKVEQSVDKAWTFKGKGEARGAGKGLLLIIFFLNFLAYSHNLVTNNTVSPIIPTDDLDEVIDLDKDEDDDDERLSTTSAESGAVTPRQATPIPHSKPTTPKTTAVPKTTQTPKIVTTKPRSTSTTRAKTPSPLSQAHKSSTPS